jgi:hypothetical protein
MKRNIVFFALMSMFIFLNFYTSAQGSGWIWAKGARGVAGDDVSSFTKGMYLVRIITDKEIVNKKFDKE